MTALSNYLTDNKGVETIDSIAAKAVAAGHSIDRGTVSRYLSGKHAKQPPEEVLQALAAGMQLDVRKLRTLAGMPPGELEHYEAPRFFDRLNRDQRKALNELIRTITEGGAEDARPAANSDDDDGQGGAAVIDIRTKPPTKPAPRRERPAARDVGKPPAEKRKKPPVDDDFEPR